MLRPEQDSTKYGDKSSIWSCSPVKKLNTSLTRYIEYNLVLDGYLFFLFGLSIMAMISFSKSLTTQSGLLQ